MSLILKFIDLSADGGPSQSRGQLNLWQRILACEFIYKISTDKHLVKLIYVNYDSKPHTENILHGFIQTVNAYLLHLFAATSTQTTTSSSSSSSSPSVVSAASTTTDYQTHQQVFLYNNQPIYMLLQQSNPTGGFKPLYIDTWDRIEMPTLLNQTTSDIYLITLNYMIVQEYVQTLGQLVDEEAMANNDDTRIQLEPLVYGHILKKTYSCLLDASYDDDYTDRILKSINQLISINFKLNMQSNSIDYLSTMCKYTLPSAYHAFISSTCDNDQENLTNAGHQQQQQQQQQHQTIVAIGAALNGSYMQQLFITNKMLQIFKYLLNMSIVHMYRLKSFDSWLVDSCTCPSYLSVCFSLFGFVKVHHFEHNGTRLLVFESQANKESNWRPAQSTSTDGKHA